MEIFAPAKVNLLLKIINKRKDGYHNLFSIIQTVSLFDRIKIDLIKNNKKDIKIKCNLPELNNEKNICYKTTKLILEKCKKNYSVKINIKKNIPIGAGLGGASSDAACVILGLKKLLKIKISKKQLIAISSKIGKDIPFFLYQGCCIVESTGEKVRKFEVYPWKNKPLWFVIVYPNIILPTKKVYIKYDEIKKKINNSKFSKQKILNLLKKMKFNELLNNDLEEAVFKLYPKLKLLKQTMQSVIGNSCMSGSGSCFFSICKSKKEAIKSKKFIEKKFKNYKIYIAKSINTPKGGINLWK
ncbi:MAG: 4-(cytidine 5'-diphospho)-2-C-methyl-D-erythritol kinase [Elusimicrobiota bacterium]|nr:4-(cytidine 5'-diphospho)-2-C-methyl-D-erythritol kinase [Endomicrobiia bacterium]MDW8165647.1 4-(cytidine 5'-diphospho)-2-C-methyl-D-erythritol kinase [Elusimicrobiota bacterium]